MNKHLVSFINENVWALPESYLLSYKAAAEAYSGPPLETRAPGSSMRSAGNIAVITVAGPITYKPTFFTALFGGAAITDLQAMFRQAMAEDSVGGILLDFSSPGGEVSGIPEFAAEILAARGTKPIIAQVSTMAASAAYWLAVSADTIAVTPSGMVGSIGVITQHVDASVALKKEGYKVTVVSAGRKKADASMTAPLSPEAHADIQARVDAFYGMFTAAVAKGRGVAQKAVSGGFGEGGIVLAAEALKLGMVDSIATFDQTVGQMVGRRSQAGMRAELTTDPAEVALSAIADAEAAELDALMRERLERF